LERQAPNERKNNGPQKKNTEVGSKQLKRGFLNINIKKKDANKG